MGTLALIGLGSNLGDRRARLDDAVAALGALPGCLVRGVSRYHETAPVGGPGGQGAFLNASAAVETSLDPVALLQALHAIERGAGRIRKERWGARTLDLDLLLFSSLVHDGPALRLPHPRMAVRRFVLAPLAEIAPDAVDPLTGRTVAGLLDNLDRRPSRVALIGPSSAALRARLVGRLDTGAHAGADERWIVDEWTGSGEPTFLAATSPESYWDQRRNSAPIGRGVPLLWPGSDEALWRGVPEDLGRMEADIFAACAATRAGV